MGNWLGTIIINQFQMSKENLTESGFEPETFFFRQSYYVMLKSDWNLSEKDLNVSLDMLTSTPGAFKIINSISQYHTYLICSKLLVPQYLPFVFTKGTMGIKRFKANCAFLHTVDPETNRDKPDRLRKVHYLVNKFKSICLELYCMYHINMFQSTKEW